MTNKKLFIIISILVLGLLLFSNFDTNLVYLPGYIIIYTLTLAINYKYLYDIREIEWDKIEFDDLAYIASPVISGWFVHILILNNILTLKFMNIVVLTSYLLSTYISVALLYGIMYLFNLVDYSNLPLTNNKVKKEEIDPREFMNETELEAELNYYIIREDYNEAKKVKSILDKKFSNG